MRKIIALLILSASLAMAFNWKQIDGKTITVMMPEHPVTKGVRTKLEDFQKATGITMNINSMAEDLYFEKMEMALRSSEGDIIVFVIIADIPSIFGPAIPERLGGAKVDQTKIQMRTLSQSFDLYYLDNNVYPSTEQGLDALMKKPEVGVIPKRWKGPYMSDNYIPRDGWGNDFIYESDQRSYSITSLGADGIEGGEDDAADINSKEL